MKIQYMAVIFVIIMLPIILVLSAYMQMQIDNLTVDLQYDTKLFEATLDGIQAFELNTVNNRFSQIADSLKRDVEAGINTYISSLSSHLGLGGVNNEYLLPYIPAVLFTLYDGYYIYAPSYAEQLDQIEVDDTDIDGNPIKITTEVSKDPKVYDYEHLLKPYIYYTTRYKSGTNTDFIVNYTLDNYMIVYGNIDGQYVTRSGFLSKPEYITYKLDKQKITAILAKKILTYVLPPRATDQMSQATILSTYNTNDANNLNEIDKVALISEMGEELFTEMVTKGNLDSMKEDEILSALFDSTINEKFTVNRNVVEATVANASSASEVGEVLYNEMVQNGTLSNLTDDEIFNAIKDRQIFYDAIDYMEAEDGKILDETIDAFTEVTYKGISITDSDAKKYYIKSLRFTNWVNDNLNDIRANEAVDDNGEQLVEFKDIDERIFQTRGVNNDPTQLDSPFAQHRMDSIKLSVQTNLNTAIAQYNVDFFNETTYNLKMPMLTPTEWNEVTNNISMVTFLQGIKVGNKIYNDYVVVSSNKNKETINEDDIYYINTDENGIIYYHKSDCAELKDDTVNVIGLKNIDYDIYKDEDKSGNIDYTFSDRLNELKADTGITEIYGCYHCIVNRNYEKVDKLNENRLKAIYTAIAKEKNNLYKVNEYYNVDILSTYVAPPTTIQGTLSEIGRLGQYVSYYGGSYGNWRILSSDSSTNTVEIISDGSTQTQTISASELTANQGFNIFTQKLTEKMRNIANGYLDGNYAVSARIAGSNSDGSVLVASQDRDISDLAKMQASNTLATNHDVGGSLGYWLATAESTDDGTYNIMYIREETDAGGNRNFNFGRRPIYREGANSYGEFGIRPIILLNTEVKVIGGSGTQTDPWQLSL